MYRIEEPLPTDPLLSEVVLHVRRLLRIRVRRGEHDAAGALSMLFGFPPTIAGDSAWRRAVKSPNPLQEGAAVAAKLRNLSGEIVPLGHDEHHVEECRKLLLSRKDEDAAFRPVIASDLATLLELSKARDLATAEGRDDEGKPKALPVVILGKTGTGKELLARGIHFIACDRAKTPNAPWEVVHVAGLSPDMINEELFGHVKGAYTGATSDRIGRLEAADGGTLLVDEVGDLPPTAQVRLLRFLQTQRLSRIGENRERQVKVRVIAATWHDLDKDVAEGKFRDDLLHRLRPASQLGLRPLAERPGVFVDVVPAMLGRFGHSATPPIARSATEALARHHWPGNLRELVGVLQEASALADGDTIRVEHLPAHIQQQYLRLALHERAVGFLADEVDGQVLDDSQAAWRVERVTHSLEVAIQPSADPRIDTLQRFLTVVDDTTEAHTRTAADVNAFAALAQRRAKALIVADLWKKILAVELPPSIIRRAEEQVAIAHSLALEIESELIQAQQQLRLEEHPWLKLLDEVVGLPALRNADRDGVIRAFLGIFNLAKTFAPQLVERMRDAVRDRGFSGARDLLVETLRSSDEPMLAAKTKPAAQLTMDEWIAFTRAFTTQAEAIDATGYDPKTIAKYLRQFEIESPWARK